MFHRAARADGTSDIVQADIVEASVTATPQLPSTSFEVVAEGKSVGNLAAHSRAVKLRRAQSAVDALALKVAAAEFASAVAAARRT